MTVAGVLGVNFLVPWTQARRRKSSQLILSKFYENPDNQIRKIFVKACLNGLKTDFLRDIVEISDNLQADCWEYNKGRI